jgi:hypothetical protein
MMIYGVLRGGRAAFGLILAFGLLGVGEAHHWLQSFAEYHYDPGLITSIPFVYVGYLIVREC